MSEQPGLSFAGLLRQLRAEAKLTQEELAEAAGLSPRSVSDLERGINRTARKDTALLLAGALGLNGPSRELFVAVARGRRRPPSCWPPRGRWHRGLPRLRRPGGCLLLAASPAARAALGGCWGRWPVLRTAG